MYTYFNSCENNFNERFINETRPPTKIPALPKPKPNYLYSLRCSLSILHSHYSHSMTPHYSTLRFPHQSLLRARIGTISTALPISVIATPTLGIAFVYVGEAV